MKRLWILLGFGLGALFIWSLLHDDRERAALSREEEENMIRLNKESQLRRAMDEAIWGPPRVSHEEVDAELKRFEEDPYWIDKEEDKYE